jgi:hypothetical protein
MRMYLGGIGILLAASAALADDTVPDLKGTWQIDAKGMAFAIPETSGPEAVEVASVFVVDHQDGFRFSGKEDSHVASGMTPVSDEELFAGVIGIDGKTVSMVDHNGFRNCVILSEDKMECIYRHVAVDRAVITRNTWTRQKD